jgi:hypothetical protein
LTVVRADIHHRIDMALVMAAVKADIALVMVAVKAPAQAIRSRSVIAFSALRGCAIIPKHTYRNQE